MIALLALLGILPYLPAWNGEALFDDEEIEKDPYFRWPRSERRWHPRRHTMPRYITRWTHGVTRALGRPADHKFSFLVHAANVLLIYGLGLRWAPAAAAPIAAIFAVHPLQVSAVAYTAARAGVLSFFFVLLVAAVVSFLPPTLPLWTLIFPLCWAAVKSKEDSPVYLLAIALAGVSFTWP